ncbi:class I SAM-dependent methyltransferase [Cytobacillus sp. IB215665]|uniref:class I SAM-dependent methyltransferase n=1 Tax=Cytobacillus sp. IB215665 TaxID=3097357 RepID=UPI002A16D230|nr:class I SAM-dependent methyltransferase [Cytobacillus sp. IB215665]MDX8366751.1 class I SAM-dependent methyltransferase [Cytobacillus sp. IB215665]
MNELEYKDFYDKVGKVNGWDFSKLKSTSEGVKWHFYDEVVKRCKRSDVLLDIGTGGGENVLEIARSANFLVGVDISSGMMETAQANLAKSNVSNVRFCQLPSDNLQFPAEFFDIVSCCHAPFNAKEISKVLKKGGIFLTQQVSEGDKLNLKTAFGRGQSFGEEDGTLQESYVQELIKAGFSNVQTFDENAFVYYERPEDLIFLLKHTPIIPRFGEEKQDLDILKDFIKQNNTSKGICSNSKRFLIIATK